MAVTVDGDAVGNILPGANRGLQQLDVVTEVNLLLDPIRHGVSETATEEITLPGRGPFHNVEFDLLSGYALLNLGEHLLLSDVDPLDCSAGEFLPGSGHGPEDVV